MTESRKLSLLRRALGPVQRDRRDKNEVVFFCPKKHTKPHLSVNLKLDWFNCWRCGFKGRNLLPLIKLSGDRSSIAEYLEETDKIVKRELKKEERKYDAPVLPEGFIPLCFSSNSIYRRSIYAYLVSRGATIDDIVRMKLGYVENGPYSNRVIFPSFDSDGDLNFVVGRSVRETFDKYLHGNYNKDIIFNEYLLDWRKPVVLVEGPFDSLTAGENSIPLQGSFIRPLLLQTIVSHGCTVNLALDSDAHDNQLIIMRRLMRCGVDVRVVDLGGSKDVNEMGKQRFQEALSMARPVQDIVTYLLKTA